MKTWFKNPKRGAQSAVVFALIADMSDVNIDIYGYLVDYTVGTDPETVWYEKE